MKEKIKGFLKLENEKDLRKIIQSQQKQINDLSTKILELDKKIDDVDNTTKSQTLAIVKNKEDIRHINITLGSSKTIKEIRQNI